MKTRAIIAIFLASLTGTVYAQDTLESVTRGLEAGDGSVIEKVIGNLCLEERIKFLKSVDALNLRHRETDASTPDLVIRITSSKVGATQLSVERKLQSLGDWFAGGVRIYTETMELYSLERHVFSTTDRR